MTMTPLQQPVLAWEVKINSLRCICFAPNKAKAQMRATISYWDAYGRRKGQWPGARAHRAPQHDQSALRNHPRQQAWSEDYVINYPNQNP